MPSLAVFEAAM